MVSAPLLVLLYDRTFVAGSLLAAWRQRRSYYVGLAASWALLGGLMASAGGNRNGSIGFGTGVEWWAYALTQFQAITRYLRLAVWPHPLIFEYGTFWVRHARDVVPHALIVGCLILGTLIAVRRRTAVGFLGCWFFAILAPTSSVVPGSTQMIVEHRMYLPLAAAMVLGVWWMHGFLQRVVGRVRGSGRTDSAPPPTAADEPIARVLLLIAFVLAAGFAFLTVQRNADYRGEEVFWRDNVAKRPSNPLAHDNLGAALLRSGKLDEARDQFEEALRLKPDDANAQNDDGTVLIRMGRVEEAMARFQEAVRLKPDYADAHYNLGAALAQTGRFADAIPQYQAALRWAPDDANAHNDLGVALAQVGSTEEAVAQFQEAVHLMPDYADARYNLGAALAEAGRLAEAIEQFEEVIRLRPNDEQARAALTRIKARLLR